MNYLHFFFFLLFSIQGLYAEKEIITQGQIYYQPINSRVKLECTASQFDIYVDSIRWYKNDKNSDQSLINVVTHIQPNFFDGNNRILIQFEVNDENPDESTYGRHLIINDIIPGDTGRYICTAEFTSQNQTSTITQEITYELVVLENFKDLTVKSNNITEYLPHENSIINVRENEESFFSCSVEGGMPRPKLAIYIDNIDKTDAFKYKLRKEELGQFPFQYHNYILSKENEKITFDYNFNGLELICMANQSFDLYKYSTGGNVKNFPENKYIAKKFTLNVTYEPKFNCLKKILLFYQQKNVTFSCIIHANPPIKPDEIYYEIVELDHINQSEKDDTDQNEEQRDVTTTISKDKTNIVKIKTDINDINEMVKVEITINNISHKFSVGELGLFLNVTNNHNDVKTQMFTFTNDAYNVKHDRNYADDTNEINSAYIFPSLHILLILIYSLIFNF